MLGMQYASHQVNHDGVEVRLKNLESQEEMHYSTRLLVDATGTDRKVIGSQKHENSTMPATGIEFHVKVSPAVYQKYSQSLNFFLGHHWMPQGYGWIFPMAANQLKVGVIRYFQNQKYVSFAPSYQHYLDRLLEQCGPYQLEDRHGKTIQYTRGQKDIRFEGHIIAIGDAISCINPLGWEGIRHALFSGRVAAQSIQNCLSKKNADFTSYNKELNRYFGYKWMISELFMRNLFTHTNDALIDKIVKNFGLMNNEEIIDVIFNYKFSRSIKSYFWYYLEKFGL